jgi:hypothetical protein
MVAGPKVRHSKRHATAVQAQLSCQHLELQVCVVARLQEGASRPTSQQLCRLAGTVGHLCIATTSTASDARKVYILDGLTNLHAVSSTHLTARCLEQVPFPVPVFAAASPAFT